MFMFNRRYQTIASVFVSVLAVSCSGTENSEFGTLGGAQRSVPADAEPDSVPPPESDSDPSVMIGDGADETGSEDPAHMGDSREPSYAPTPPDEHPGLKGRRPRDKARRQENKLAAMKRRICSRIRCQEHQVCRFHEPSGRAMCVDECSGVECEEGMVCELEPVQCVTEPCPPVARCVPAPQPACTLPADPGPCRAAMRRWRYSEDAGRCVVFRYGGCGGNANNFRTREACEGRCSNAPSPPDDEPCEGPGCEDEPGDEGQCGLPIESGPCRAALLRWAHNPETGACERFTYGGCGGNANNFTSLEACEAQCGAPNACQLPPEVGPCRGFFLRWHHNPETRSCERFVYGGCGGNRNNFGTKQECQEACDCLPADPCEGVTCRDHQICRVHEPTGEAFCADTCQNFPCDSGEKCELTDVTCVRAPCPPIAQCVPRAQPLCSMPPDVGPCDAVIPRWYHNSETGLCEQFNWGGCEGNENNFETRRACEKACDCGPCSMVRCQDHQVCDVFEPTGEAFCKDTCEGFTCPDEKTCALQEVQCIRAPCPPIAVCQ